MQVVDPGGTTAGWLRRSHCLCEQPQPPWPLPRPPRSGGRYTGFDRDHDGVVPGVGVLQASCLSGPPSPSTYGLVITQ